MKELHKIVREEMEKYPSRNELDMDFYKNIVEAKNFDSMFNYGYRCGFFSASVPLLQAVIDMVESEIENVEAYNEPYDLGRIFSLKAFSSKLLEQLTLLKENKL